MLDSMVEIAFAFFRGKIFDMNAAALKALNEQRSNRLALSDGEADFVASLLRHSQRASKANAAEHVPTELRKFNVHLLLRENEDLRHQVDHCREELSRVRCSLEMCEASSSVHRGNASTIERRMEAQVRLAMVKVLIAVEGRRRAEIRDEHSQELQTMWRDHAFAWQRFCLSCQRRSQAAHSIVRKASITATNAAYGLRGGIV